MGSVPTLRRCLVVLWVLLVGFAPASRGADLAGSVRLVDDRGREVVRAAGTGVAWFEPDGRFQAATPGEYEVNTSRKRFEPRVTVVPRGSTVGFPNQDPILHNVFSVSEGNSFDLGLLPKGPGEKQRFENSGVVRVFCNVHHSMVAYVVVVDTPFHTVVDGNGRFVLRDLPEGPGTLTVWHERGEPVQRRLDPGLADEPLSFSIQATRPLVPQHLNKLGKPYSRRDRY